MNYENLSVIIPVYNEAQTIGLLVKEIRSLYPGAEVIVINDGSTDDTVAEATEAGGIVFSHPYNIGNGAAIKSGIRIASGEIFVFMDGDGQHDPADIAQLVQPIPEFDMVVGARGSGQQASFFRALGNRAYNRLASYVSSFSVKDLTSGFRAIRAEVAHRLLYLLPNAYSYPTTLTLSVLRSGRSVKYVAIDIKKRKRGKSKIKTTRDGLRFLLIILKICTLYSPFRIFLPVSIIMFLFGLLNYIYTYVTRHSFTNMSALLFTTSVLVFMLGLVSEQICQMRFERSEGYSKIR